MYQYTKWFDYLEENPEITGRTVVELYNKNMDLDCLNDKKKLTEIELPFKLLRPLICPVVYDNLPKRPRGRPKKLLRGERPPTKEKVR